VQQKWGSPKQQSLQVSSAGAISKAFLRFSGSVCDSHERADADKRAAANVLIIIIIINDKSRPFYFY
jgi:hypothetical protein